MLDEALLDDPGRLQAGESGELLRAAAMAGAQVRATTEAAAEIKLDETLRGAPPRALVLLTRPGVGSSAAGILRALLGPGCPVPVVAVDSTPPWVGPLDVLVGHTADENDRPLADSVDLATRRGAQVVLTAPEYGPVAAAAAGRARLIIPRVSAPPTLALATALTAGLLVTRALGLLRTDIDGLADELDREAERNHPQHESFVSPAKSLALRLAQRSPLLLGLDPVATAVAKHAAATLGAHAGLLAVATGYRALLAQPALHRAAVRAASPANVFHDPYLDDLDGTGDDGAEPASARALRVMLMCIRADDAAGVARQAATGALASADELAPGDEVTGDEPLLAALLASRFDLAALYLGLATGTLGGPGLTAPVRA
jgi:Bacterial phospho-glucose isomerase C-terminal SIS domain